MLSVPEYGWTDFSIGDAKYQLSYLTDIPIEWLETAVYSLKKNYYCPFTVYGDCETSDIHCTVTEMFCHVIHDGTIPPKTYFVNMSMLDFCKALYVDISRDIDAWSDWLRYDDENFREKQKFKIQSLLNELDALIKERSKRGD
ncbi:MAG: hypothetical protein IJL14_02395 [Selenomonadaceae bacterium]|nr:hypothetical protein [Selenomonadaceae bacterium]